MLTQPLERFFGTCFYYLFINIQAPWLSLQGRRVQPKYSKQLRFLLFLFHSWLDSYYSDELPESIGTNARNSSSMVRIPWGWGALGLVELPSMPEKEVEKPSPAEDV